MTHLSTGLAILAGTLTILSPCVLPVLPIVMSRSLHTHRFGPVALVLGLVAGFAVIGSLLGFTSRWLTDAANLLRQGAIALLLMLGVLSLFPSWTYRLVSHLRLGKPSLRAGLAGEFWLGTQLGLLWTPCAGPILGSILVLAAVKHQVWQAFTLLVAYGLGAAIPLLLIAYAGRYASQTLLRVRSHSAILQKIGGLAIVITAIAILLGWDVQIQLLLAPLLPTSPL